MTTVLIWLAMVFFLSVMPTEGGPTPFEGADKAVHFILYFITCLLFYVELKKKQAYARSLVLAVLLSSLYGYAMEVAQSYTDARTYSLADESANIAGALAGAAFLHFATKKARTKAV